MSSPDPIPTTLSDHLRQLGLVHAAADLNDFVARATQKRWSPILLLEHLIEARPSGSPNGHDSFLAHHSFLSTLTGRQLLEKWCRCGGSIKSISSERDTFGQEQLLEALLLIERRLHP